ncbi:recombinase family protein [Devosia psychrophila]|uniref:DNA invertase n=1 Tax=Devosia psychrophila TaxID=728005 RepID=A0A0F5PZK7_9HYPH|nr:recombinase family protein [Devosia psychrophila]KKC33259.1 DNA invertase [Devosia psychrophila]SFC24945.1 Recombinase [Devosia psychrophila]
MKQYVTYTRVSTAEQGRSGLGLEAQQRDIDIFLTQFSAVPFEVIGSFQDTLSGATDDRPELQKALKLVRDTGSELLVAKLDRLSRKVSFIAAVMDDPKVSLRVAQMPQADKFQLHIYAALAEQERDFISARTKAALQAAKARGQKLGGLRDKTMKRNAALLAQTIQGDKRVLKIIAPLQVAGKNLSQIASLLNEMNVATARGGTWTAKQVSRILERVNGEPA